MKLLVIRMLGLGDVAAIGIPAVRVLRERHPDATITFLTFGAGAEIAELVPEIDRVALIDKEQWPDDIVPAMQSFSAIAQDLAREEFDVVYNLDTWFLPCFLARLFHDVGVELRGNYLRWSVKETIERVNSGELTQYQVKYPAEFLASTFPDMDAWMRPWWKEDPTAGPYPNFYLNRCCGFEGELDFSIAGPTDEQLKLAANGKPIIALATRARTVNRRYRHGEELRNALEAADCYVWTGFDGSVPMRTTLASLRASDLLITVASAPQWLARATACPVLMIPGHVPPAVLRADVTIERFIDCQFCMQNECGENLDFACMDVPPDRIVDTALAHLAVGHAPR